MHTRALVRRFWRDERGLAVTEYGLLIALVATALVVAVQFFRDDIARWFARVFDPVAATRP